MSQDWLFSTGVVVFHLESECKEQGLRKFCRKHNLDAGHVSKIINGKKPMSENVAECLGYKKAIKWNKVK